MFNHGDANSIRMVIRGAEVGILAGAEDIIMVIATLGITVTVVAGEAAGTMAGEEIHT